MKKLLSFFKTSKRIYITLGLGLGFSLPQLTTIYLPQESIKLLKDQHFSRRIINSSERVNLIKNIENWRQKRIDKIRIKNITVNNDRSPLKTVNTGNKSYSYKEMRLMEATAYYPGPECTGKNAIHGRTYTGKKARYGLVAVDPKVIPLGTKLYIEGYGKAEAADIGEAIKGNKIDLCYNTYQEAKQFGRKKIKVYLLK